VVEKRMRAEKQQSLQVSYRSFFRLLEGGNIMVSVIVVAAYAAVLVGKWYYFAKYSKVHR
jgi:hypothetical protein